MVIIVNSRIARVSQLTGLFLVALLVTACTVPLPGDLDEGIPELPPAVSEYTPEVPIEISPTPTAVQIDLESLAIISRENINQIFPLADLEPYFPPYTALSADGRVAALGRPWGVLLIDMESGEPLMEIPARIPECQFGAQRYMALSADGSFIALVTFDNLQVWQVGGGLLFEKPYSRRFSTDMDTCGMDMPVLALSPNGRLLAVSGMTNTREALTRFFRIIDIIKNEIVYEWDRSPHTMHGSLDAAPGLGFSSDGRILQTFDALRFVRPGEAPGSAFRFWDTRNWGELEPSDAAIVDSYSTGDLLFVMPRDAGLEVRVKTSGALVARLPQAPCSRIYPCLARFSPDGTRAVLLSMLTDRVAFRVSLLADRLIVADLHQSEILEGPRGLFRDLEGVLISDNGQVLQAYQPSSDGIPGGAWWLSADRFEGFLARADGKLIFTPQVFFQPGDKLSEPPQRCIACAVCQLDAASIKLDCQPGFVSAEGNLLTLARDADGLRIIDPNGDKVGELALPTELVSYLPAEYPATVDGTGLVVHILGFSEAAMTAFYCLDVDQRPIGCYMQNLQTGHQVAWRDMFSHVRFSPEGRWASLYDEHSSRLFLADMDSGSLVERAAWRARAYPVSAQFYNGSGMLAYLIQDQYVRTLFWLEIVEMESSRTIRRISLKDARLSDPVALSADAKQRWWALGERDGRALLLDFESGEVIYEWQAHAEGLVGLQFAADDRLLVSMDPKGLLRAWGIAD